jgi:hypothetical protein
MSTEPAAALSVIISIFLGSIFFTSGVNTLQSESSLSPDWKEFAEYFRDTKPEPKSWSLTNSLESAKLNTINLAFRIASKLEPVPKKKPQKTYEKLLDLLSKSLDQEVDDSKPSMYIKRGQKVSINSIKSNPVDELPIIIAYPLKMTEYAFDASTSITATAIDSFLFSPVRATLGLLTYLHLRK